MKDKIIHFQSIFYFLGFLFPFFKDVIALPVLFDFIIYLFLANAARSVCREGGTLSSPTAEQANASISIHSNDCVHPSGSLRAKPSSAATMQEQDFIVQS